MMIFEKVYEEFVNYTGLSDSVYRSVFSNVFEILDKVKTISWDYLEYKDNTRSAALFDFSKVQKVPRYVVEIFQNVFKNYYTLPSQSLVTIGVTVNSVPYKITSSSEGTEIPSELEFIKKYKLYDIFILDKPVYDLFGAFDEEFNFTSNFKAAIQDVFQPLKRKFDKSEATNLIRDSGLSANKVAESQFNVEGIQNRINEILERVDSIRQKRDATIIKRNKIFSGVNSREGLLFEKEKYINEFDTLQETKSGYEEKLGKLMTLINAIDAELSDVELRKISQKDMDFLLQKKTIFTKDKDSVEKSLSDFDGFLNDLQGRIRAINDTLAEVDEYTTNDVSMIDAEIKALNTEQDDLYGILIGLESELKHQKKILNESAIHIEKAQSYSDITIQNVENSAIVSHLAMPLHPASVTTVINYLRYYFAYNATQLANSLLSETPNFDTYLAQAVAVKLTLIRNFGIYLNQIFSAVDFTDNRIAKTIIIVKE